MLSHWHEKQISLLHMSFFICCYSCETDTTSEKKAARLTVILIYWYYIQLTLVISNSLISNNRLSRSENLVPA